MPTRPEQHVGFANKANHTDMLGIDVHCTARRFWPQGLGISGYYHQQGCGQKQHRHHNTSTNNDDDDYDDDYNNDQNDADVNVNPPTPYHPETAFVLPF